MKTVIAFFAFVLLSYNIPLFSQSRLAGAESLQGGQACLPEGIIFTKQSQIDSFQINYPNCTVIEGSVVITGDEITNLNGLEVLTYIGGNLKITAIYTPLSILTGLHNIEAVGGDLKIQLMALIVSLEGLNNIKQIGGSLVIRVNPMLESLAGLEKLESIAGDLRIEIYVLRSLKGLNSLTSIGGDLKIRYCYPLRDLNGLANLTTIGRDFLIEDCALIVSFTGLNNLRSIGGDLWIEDLQRIVSLMGLNNVTSIGGYINLEGCTNLTSLKGLDNIEAGSIDSLYIFRNPQLSKCEIKSVCDFLVNTNGVIFLDGNAPGCNSTNEIETACESSCLPEGISFTSQAQIDNFQINYNDCNEIEGDVEIVSTNGTSISDLKGLSSITSIKGNLRIEGNELLNSLSGLDSLTYLGGSLSLENNNFLANFAGLDNLTSVRKDIMLSQNENLTSTNGLNNLAYIGANLVIKDNTNLKSLSGMSKVNYIDGDLRITNNEALTSISGLDYVDFSYTNNIFIYDNNSLSYCEVLSMCNFLDFSSRKINIYNNATGCNDPEEIANACGLSVSDNIGMLRKESEIKDLRIQQTRVIIIGLGALILIIIVGTIIFLRQRKIRAQHTLELERVKSEKLKELDRLKSRFFANISHEFRTPLTLIMGPLDKVLSQSKNRNHKKELGISKKYALNLQNLINNLLTISKLESGKMKLQTFETDVVKLVGTYIQSFESLAKQKNITLNFKAEEENTKAYIDREKFEQVLNNLLSNAFKFTRDGGRIDVSVTPTNLNCHFDSALAGEKSAKYLPHQSGDSSPESRKLSGSGFGMTDKNDGDGHQKWAEIKISDTGPGIHTDHLPHIFDRFYQAGQENSSYYEGTSIGLALTKELVELHHGTIKVESDPDSYREGIGSTFTILLPLGKEHLKPEEIKDEKDEEIIKPIVSSEVPDELNESVLVTEDISEPNDKHPILLIVEDNADMRSYIRGYFENEFQLVEAIDGADGYEKSTAHIPDIIISDVMMPIMDGVELCKKVKTDERTSHIPLILLTARASKESRMEGLETGADDFITKPFDGDELQVRVKNLIDQRKRLSAVLERKIQKSHSIEKLDLVDCGITSMDDKFLQKAKEVINENLSDPEYSVEDFASAMAISRFQLHRKLKALINNSGTEFIRNLRLNYSIELLQKKAGTISEIAYDSGFNNPTYFSKIFKQKFGMPPSEYQNNIR